MMSYAPSARRAGDRCCPRNWPRHRRFASSAAAVRRHPPSHVRPSSKRPVTMWRLLLQRLERPAALLKGRRGAHLCACPPHVVCLWIPRARHPGPNVRFSKACHARPCPHPRVTDGIPCSCRQRCVISKVSCLCLTTLLPHVHPPILFARCLRLSVDRPRGTRGPMYMIHASILRFAPSEDRGQVFFSLVHLSTSRP